MSPEVRNQVLELMRNISPAIIDTCSRLYRSEAIDVESYKGNEVALAKILLTAALREHANDFIPLFDQKHLRDLENLKHF